MADDIQALWNRSDEHGKRLEDLTVNQKIMEKTLTDQQQEFKRTNKDNTERHHELKTLMTKVSGNVETVMTDFHKRQGVQLALQWGVPVIISIAGLYAIFGN